MTNPRFADIMDALKRIIPKREQVASLIRPHARRTDAQRPTSKEQIIFLLSVVIMVAMGLGHLWVIMGSIIPNLRIMNDKTVQLASVRKEVVEAERAQQELPEKLRADLARAQKALDEKSGFFLSEAQAAEALRRLSQYAERSGVAIVGLEQQPSPEKGEHDVHDVETFSLQVEGSLPDLVSFVSRIEEASMFKTYLIANVGIVSDVLTMDVTFYTSSYSSDETLEEMLPVEVGSPQPTVTRPMGVSAPQATDTPTVVATAQATTTVHPYLVRPTDWPTNWPWPPRSETETSVPR